MATIYDKAQNHLSNRLPFVLYNKPNNGHLVGLFQKDTALYTANQFTESGFVFAPFNGTPIVLIPENQSEVLIENWTADGNAMEVSIPDSDHQGQIAFENLVSKGIEAIHKNEFQKVVLSRTETVNLSHFDAMATFKKLLNNYPAAFTYCFFHPEVGMWFGASPEQLLKVNSNKFETIALAGTQKFEGNENVNWENKEQEEQRFVTDFILENLENVTSDMAFSNPYTYRAGNLLHIKTDISGTLHEDSNVKQLLDILHPTPAVCGLPKEKARDFILEHEGYDRRFYSGYLGEFDVDFHSEQRITDLFVNLRCMEIKGDSAVLYIGCGVTKDSDPHKEYIETVNKSMTIKKILF